jgi:hypothetical protein
MKFNWGTGIALFYSVFVLIFVSLVVRSRQFDNSLVSDQYYADDLRYQEHYEKLLNSQRLEHDLEIGQAEGVATFQFPPAPGPARGEIHFFCPSDSRQDFRVPVRPDAGGRQIVPVDRRKPGLWKVKVDWRAGESAYYKEEILIF